MIEIFDLQKVTLDYCSQIFCSPSKYPTLDNLYRIFGCTKPIGLSLGIFDFFLQISEPTSVTNEYMLCYRGLCFALTQNASELFGIDGDDSEDFVVKKLFIFSGNSYTDPETPNLPTSSLQGNTFAEKISVIREGNRTMGLSMQLISLESFSNPNKESKLRNFSTLVKFGDHVQDVVSGLGAPNRIYYKTDDKMKIHLPQSQRILKSSRSNYFYNYFTLGLDILFDAMTHKSIKFILHNNLPNDCNFNIYHRCQFMIRIERPEGGYYDISPLSHVSEYSKLISQWSEVHKVIGADISSQPVVLHRESKSKKPLYPPTLAYGYTDMIFEVLPNSDYLASVTLYANWK
ncbi:hypothetical protein Ciccas_009151 [Cichlidogyrus casuarinus]|uniref:Uncharacterized protein n=1 Tax=Cichlidogyrus casuarinus TaxID=1844966 RepID=A0ABD2PYV6_9PLAT